jgi:beta-lactamase class A
MVRKAVFYNLKQPIQKRLLFMKPRSSSSSHSFSNSRPQGFNQPKPAVVPASAFYYDAPVVTPVTTGRNVSSNNSLKSSKSTATFRKEELVSMSPFYHDDRPLNHARHPRIGSVHVGLPAAAKVLEPSKKSSHQQRHIQQKKRVQRLVVLLAGALLAGGLLVSGLFQLGQWAVSHYAPMAPVDNFEASTVKPDSSLPLTTSARFLQNSAFELPTLRVNQTALMGIDSWLNPSLTWPYERVALAPLPPLALPAETINTTLQSDLDSLALQLGLGFRPHVLFYDPFSNTHAELNAQEPVPSASVIKLPLLYLYGLRLASGIASPSDTLLLEERHRVEGSGIWIGKPAHSRFSLGETAANMIQSSDNVATEMMLESLGGVEKVNQQWRALGYSSTRVRNQLPDKAGMNTISMTEMVQTLMGIQHHSVFQSGQANLQLMDILEKTHNRRLIPGMLPKETKVFHKTGDIGKSLGESALVQLPDGRYYYLAMMVERPHNNGLAADFIRLFSKRVYEYQVSHNVVRNQPLLATISGDRNLLPVVAVIDSVRLTPSAPTIVSAASSVVASSLPTPPDSVEVF